MVTKQEIAKQVTAIRSACSLVMYAMSANDLYKATQWAETAQTRARVLGGLIEARTDYLSRPQGRA